MKMKTKSSPNPNKRSKMLSRIHMVAWLFAVSAALSTTMADAKPLKIYILAGQSNMQGQARDSAFAGMAMDPKAKTLHDELVDASGKPRVFDKVDIVAYSGGRPEGPELKAEVFTKQGKLTVGYGSDLSRTDYLGPELAFGATIYDKLKEPILLIKTSWGGKSLLVDFRPPSGGAYYKDPEEVKDYKTNKGAIITREEQLAKPGHYYRLMMQHIQTVLADPGKYCPAYDPKEGYEIAGFAWFQGFNDLVGPYPPADPNDKTKGAAKDYSEYSRLLACFIRDVRKDLSAPHMPFAIGVLGVGGKDAGANTALFRKAMAAPAAMDEFKGNVKAVNTADFWDEKLGELENRKSLTSEKKGRQKTTDDKYNDLRLKLAPLLKELATVQEQPKTGQTKGMIAKLNQQIQDTLYTPEEQDYIAKNRCNQGYHYLGSAKTYSQIGEALAKALLEMRK